MFYEISKKSKILLLQKKNLINSFEAIFSLFEKSEVKNEFSLIKKISLLK
jgi:hypothetical protein